MYMTVVFLIGICYLLYFLPKQLDKPNQISRQNVDMNTKFLHLRLSSLLFRTIDFLLGFPESRSSSHQLQISISSPQELQMFVYTPSAYLKTLRYLHCLAEVQGKSRFVGPQCLHLWCCCSDGHFFWSLQGDSCGWSCGGAIPQDSLYITLTLSFILILLGCRLIGCLFTRLNHIHLMLTLSGTRPTEFKLRSHLIVIS